MTKKNESKFKLEKTPVIAVMGHVDHGKTSFLDAVRGTNVQGGEAGGITQNTRAHQIIHNGQKITFIDTPGHEAFTEMRSRGARVTDIVLLVVAADDGVQPQTKESIKFAHNSKTPIVVAINKIDLPGANPAKVKQELSQNNVLVEDFGGDVQTVEISAKNKTNLDGLLEALLLQAEILELKNAKVAQGIAESFVLESRLDETRGPLSLILMKAGEIKVGDFIVTPGHSSKIRGIMDEFGNSLQSASEGDPVMIIGLDKVLPTGEVLLFESDQKKAIELSNKFEQSREIDEPMLIDNEESEGEGEVASDASLLAALIGEKKDDDSIKYLNIVLRTDAQGTLEAVLEKLNQLGDDEVKVKILIASTGKINEKDILTAKNSKGIVIGFQTQLPQDVEMIAKREKVLVRNYEIIYKLIEEVSMVLESMLEPTEEIVEVARAKVKVVFELSNKSKVAGSKVLKGIVMKGYKCFVMRGDEEIGTGRIISLKHLKNDVKEVKKDQECGIIIEPELALEPDDEIVCYKVEKS